MKPITSAHPAITAIQRDRQAPRAEQVIVAELDRRLKNTAAIVADVANHACARTFQCHFQWFSFAFSPNSALIKAPFFYVSKATTYSCLRARSLPFLLVRAPLQFFRL